MWEEHIRETTTICPEYHNVITFKFYLCPYGKAIKDILKKSNAQWK